jgi:ATP-dependent Lon protease
MARATGREFVKVALGGVGDEAEIRGHRKTYLGSMPGKIILAMKQAKTTNPLILLDEIDKLSSDSRGDPASALLEVLDYQQNSKFVDHYLEVEYDLSNVMFVATANSLKIARPLLDRLELIKVPSYLESEKFKIGKEFIIPRQLKENGLSKEEFKITDGAIMDTIKYYTREAGVRDLERKIAKLCRKGVIETLKTKRPVEITSKNLKEYLGVKKYEHTIIERKDFVGVVNGLAYTEVGGDILMIEAVKLPNGKGELKFTGELGNVMKESIQTAFSLVKSKAKEFGIDPEIFKTTDIHIHVPDGATPKDGPSAGITMVSALVSLLTGKPVSKHLAMTGEISLRGAVLPIGGLREKLTSAVRSGVKEVIIPKDNEKDLEEIPQDVIKKLKIHPCDRIEKVMKVVF